MPLKVYKAIVGQKHVVIYTFSLPAGTLDATEEDHSLSNCSISLGQLRMHCVQNPQTSNMYVVAEHPVCLDFSENAQTYDQHTTFVCL